MTTFKKWNLKRKNEIICLENSFNFDKGIAVKRDAYKEIIQIAKKFSLPISMDGARIFNAAVTLGKDVSDMVDFFDSVAICLSKGLAALRRDATGRGSCSSCNYWIN